MPSDACHDLPPQCALVSEDDARFWFLEPLRTQGSELEEDGWKKLCDLGTEIWSYCRKRTLPTQDLLQEEDMICSLSDTLSIEQEYAELIFLRLLSRYETCFPEHLQTLAEDSGGLVRVDIPEDFPEPSKVNWEALPDPDYEMDDSAQDFITLLSSFDDDLDHVSSDCNMEDRIILLFCESFERWLAAKGLKEDAPIIRDCVLDYFEGLFAALALLDLSFEQLVSEYLPDFFHMDLVTREGIGPNAYTWYLDSVQLAYTYLAELDVIEDINPCFEILGSFRDLQKAVHAEFMKTIRSELQ